MKIVNVKDAVGEAARLGIAEARKRMPDATEEEVLAAAKRRAYRDLLLYLSPIEDREHAVKDGEFLGKSAYEIYADTVGGVSFDGKPLRKWEEMPEKIREAWEESANFTYSAGMSNKNNCLREDAGD